MNKKRVIAGTFVFAMLILSIVIAPTTAKAEAQDTITNEDGVCYILDEEEYNFASYWKDNKKVPVKENYVFGGWYQKEKDTNTMIALKESAAKTAAENGESAYAKFVPADVLSIKAQNDEEVSETSTTRRSIRIISSVDSLNYQKVGFDIFLNNDENRKVVDDKTGGDTYNTEVYATLQNDVDSEAKYPNQEFHKASKHFSVWRVDNIHYMNDSKIIYARPYWVTLDGTKVYGLAKYVHIEDEYKNYISVPINLLTGADVAAGQVSLTYKSDVFTYVGFEAGRLLPEMYANPATAGKVSIVGNAAVGSDGTYNHVNADGIYGNVRFSVNQGQTALGQTIDMTAGAFCDWDKNDVTLSAWDVLVKPAVTE